MPLAAALWATALVAAFIVFFLVQAGPSTNTVGVSGAATQVIVMGTPSPPDTAYRTRNAGPRSLRSRRATTS